MKSYLLFLTLAAALVFSQHLNAQCNWIGPVGGNWNNASHWSCGHVPGVSDAVTINGSAVSVDVPVIIASLSLANCTLTAGWSMSVTNVSVDGVVTLNSAALYNIGSDLVLNSPDVLTMNDGGLAFTGSAKMIVSAGATFNAGANTALGGGGGFVNNGTFTKTGPDVYGWSLPFVNNGTMNLPAGAYINWSISGPNPSVLGNVTGSGTFQLSGNGTDTIQFNGSLDNILLRLVGNSVCHITAPQTNSNTIEMNGGTITGSPLTIGAPGNLIFYGGIIKSEINIAAGAAVHAFNGGPSYKSIELRDNSKLNIHGIFHQGGYFNVLMHESSEVVIHPTGTMNLYGGFSAVFSGNTTAGITNNGRVNKVEAGIHRVDVPFHNADTISVQTGTLDVDATFSNAATGVIKGTGIFDVTGAAFANNGHVAPGLSPGTLNWAGNFLNGTLDIEIQAGPPLACDLLNVVGDITLAGSVLNVSQLDCIPNGSYDIITYTGARTGSFATLDLPPGHTLTYNDAAKKVRLDYTDPPPVVICPDDQTITISSGCSGLLGTWSPVSVSDNCTPAGAITLTQHPDAGTTLSGPNDTETVTLTAEDENYNTADCNFTVTLVIDPLPAEVCDGLDNDCDGLIDEDGHPDLDALLALYNSTDGPNWVFQDGWAGGAAGTDCNVCAWEGVTCDVDGRVSELSLVFGNLSGTLPAELGGLSRLVTLNLNYNQLTGAIPSEMGDLDNLTNLYLSNNQLTGNIPPELGNMSALRELYLSNNNLSGSLPAALSSLSNLIALDLTHNQLTGNIPPELGNLDNLQLLALGENQLTGSIPPELGDLSNLLYIHLRYNQLTGSIPTELGNLSSLEDLNLEFNQLTGNIPASLGNLSNLNTFTLSDNQLSGPIPASLGNLANLLYIFLQNNQLTGSIPIELGNLSYLTSLVVSNNQLTGNIPADLGNLMYLYHFDLAHNQLTGSIPAELGNLEYLGFLFLNNNQLSGCFDPNLDNLCSVIEKDFSNNPGLPGGGDFPAFCANGMGDCSDDGDGDGYPPATDCNDNNPNIHPGATEVCNGVDDNCDGQTDEGVLLTFYADADGDGYGDAGSTTQACVAPGGYVSDNTDCDDANAATNPGATEVCNGVDDNCNGQTDEGVLLTFYADADGDGYGDAGSTTQACVAPGGYVSDNTDCDDANAATNPGATEVCNGADDDCDGQTDEGTPDSDGDGICNALDNCPTTYNPDQADNEGDGIGDVCDNNDDNDPKLDHQDCAPFNPNIYPDAPEICGNLIDDDCDNKIDEPFGLQTLNKQDVLCNGQATGSITVTGTCGLPPYSYLWDNGATTATISGLVAGEYKVTITDAQGLTKVKNHNIAQPSVLNVTMAKNDVDCFGGSDGTATANPSGGKSPYTYAWSNGGTTKTITGLTTGAYLVTVTDFNGCTKVGGVEVNQPTQLIIVSTSVGPDPAHPGKFQITVTATGGTPYTNGYRYRRCNSGGTGCTGWQVSNVLTNIPAGTYLVRVKDKNTCQAEQQVTVAPTPEPEADALNVADNQVFEDQKAAPASRLWPYPNPAGGEMWVLIPVEAPEGEAGSIEIMDANGRVVLQTNATVLPGEPARIDLANLNSGVYSLLWRTQSDVVAARFIIAKQ